jgi:hypothetical protein
MSVPAAFVGPQEIGCECTDCSANSPAHASGTQTGLYFQCTLHDVFTWRIPAFLSDIPESINLPLFVCLFIGLLMTLSQPQDDSIIMEDEYGSCGLFQLTDSVIKKYNITKERNKLSLFIAMFKRDRH